MKFAHSSSWIITGIMLTALLLPGCAARTIFEAARNGNYHQVKAMIEDDTSLINARDQHKWTPLHHAADQRLVHQVPRVPQRVPLALRTGARQDRAHARGLPDDGEVHYSLGLLVAEGGRLPEAERWLRKASEAFPDRPRVFYNHGLTLQHLERRPEAEQQLLRANEIDPNDVDVVHALAIFYFQGGNFERAHWFARRLVDLAPGAQGPMQLLQQIEAQAAAQ